MPLSFLVPAFLVGLLAVAVPVIVHLTRKQRAKIEVFPSLMFLEKVPYQAENRRQIHHWFLLALRALAIVLLVAAFARPFLDRSGEVGGASSGPREVAVLVDRSYSMSLGDHWQRALEAAASVVDRLGPLDRASVVFFARSATVAARSTSDRTRLRAALDSATVGSEATRYGPGLKLAQTIFEESELPSRELVFISDFQRSGWTGEEGVTLPPGTVVTPVAVGEAPPENIAVADVTLTKQIFSGRERVTPAARLTRVGGEAERDVEVVLEVGGRELQRVGVTLPATGGAQVTFDPVTLDEGQTRGTVRVDEDALAADNERHFVISPGQATGVVVVGDAAPSAGSSATALFVRRALGITTEGTFDVVTRGSGPSQDELAGRRVVVLHDRPFPGGAAGQALEEWIAEGGGLVVALGERASWPGDRAHLLPGPFGAVQDRGQGRGSRLGELAYDHPVFEVFAGPRSGDFTATRFYRARPLQVTESDSVRILARFDDGSVALAERRYGDGRVLVWASTLDNFWNDLALQPVFLPFAHQLVAYASGRSEAVESFLAGSVIDVTDVRAMATAGLGEAAAALAAHEERVAFSPSGESVPLPVGTGPHYLTLEEQGFYEIRPPGNEGGPALAVAVNVDLTEGDLAPLDPAELAASIEAREAAPHAPGEAARAEALQREDQERRQSLWRSLLLVAFIVLVAETAVSNHISRRSRRRGAHARA